MAEIEEVRDRTPLWRVTAEGRPLSARLLCDEVVGSEGMGKERAGDRRTSEGEVRN
jgi:hypothetical protein